MRWNGDRDNQGNPIDAEGRLVIVDVRSIDEITDEDFLVGERNIGLPKISEQLIEALRTNARKIIRAEYRDVQFD